MKNSSRWMSVVQFSCVALAFGAMAFTVSLPAQRTVAAPTASTTNTTVEVVSNGTVDMTDWRETGRVIPPPSGSTVKQR